MKNILKITNPNFFIPVFGFYILFVTSCISEPKYFYWEEGETLQYNVGDTLIYISDNLSYDTIFLDSVLISWENEYLSIESDPGDYYQVIVYYFSYNLFDSIRTSKNSIVYYRLGKDIDILWNNNYLGYINDSSNTSLMFSGNILSNVFMLENNEDENIKDLFFHKNYGILKYSINDSITWQIVLNTPN